MALILSIETATTVCSIAIHKDGKLLGNQSLYIAQSHSGLLVPSIHSLLSYCGFEINDLQAVALSKGPGSYTGLRIGTSTAKGLCHALDVPLIAINTLEAMAFGVSKVQKEEVMLCPMIDARRMEVYCLVSNGDGQLIKETSPVIVDENSFHDLLSTYKVYFFGNGAGKCKNVINSPNARFIDGVYPDAIHVGAMACNRYEQQDFEDLVYFDPFYLKDFRVTKPKSK